VFFGEEKFGSGKGALRKKSFCPGAGVPIDAANCRPQALFEVVVMMFYNY
jgi:hypothetical protein